MSGDLAAALEGLAGSPAAQATLAALATFVLEDAATLACGVLVAAGHMTLGTAFAGLAVGIAVGDVGLHAAGRWLGPRLVSRGWVSAASLDAAARRFERHAVAALVGSRFVPGLRLPTYLASGVLRAPLGTFVPVVAACSVAWVGLLLWVTLALDQALLSRLGSWRWAAAAGAVVASAAAQALLSRARSRREEGPPVASAFEFWPPWLFYLPVGAWYALLALRHRSLLLPSAANPSIHAGGLLGESKSEVLGLVRGDARRYVAEHVVLERRHGAARAELLAEARELLGARGIALPVVCKPDLGMRGSGVRPCRDEAALGDYLESFPSGARVVLQRLVGEGPGPEPSTLPERLRGVSEAGVLWWRDPGTGRSDILSITLKRFPALRGDGRSTLAELIDACPRARLLRERYRTRHRERLGLVLAEGERFPLVFAGNHCQGAIFLDGTDLVTPELRARFDGIASSMGDFWFGRFDVRFRDPAAFLRGEDLAIVEINGAGAEATHVWDPSARLLSAWRTLCRQWSILFRIGAANRRRGIRPLPLRRLLRDVAEWRRLSALHPVTD